MKKHLHLDMFTTFKELLIITWKWTLCTRKMDNIAKPFHGLRAKIINEPKY